MKNKQTANLTSSIALLLVSIIIIFLAFKQQNQIKNEQSAQVEKIKNDVQQIKETLPKESTLPDYESLSELKNNSYFQF